MGLVMLAKFYADFVDAGLGLPPTAMGRRYRNGPEHRASKAALLN